MELDRPAPRNHDVPLASDDGPLCKVVAPDSPNWQELAHRFCVRVREYSRAEPKLTTPDAMTEEDTRRYHLVLFGSILNNPAILRLYVRQQCFTDTSYPGLNGVEIRTIGNPLLTGKNVLLIGGSDFSQVHEATIGLHRSFSEVTSQDGDTLTLRRLNFCVSAANCHWTPTDTDRERLLREVAAAPTTGLARAADFALFHYQTDRPEWARLVRDVIEACAADEAPTDDGWKFAVAWPLIQSSPYFTDDFRLDVDRLLLRLGRRLIAEIGPSAARHGLTRGVTCAAFGVRRMSDHFRRLYGEDPFAASADTVARVFDRDDPGIGPDGERDWLAVDQWLSVQLEQAKYQRLSTGILSELTREAIATTDNLKRPLGDPSDRHHARNVLQKIAAFEDDGRPLWVRRWLKGDDPDDAYPRDRATVAWNWYTGPYAPDRLPTQPHDIPRIVTLRNAAGDVRLLVCRHSLDPAREYVALQGHPGGPVPVNGIRRLTWNGEAWLSDGAWAKSSRPAHLIRQADLPGFGYAALATESADSRWTRHLFWRFGELLFLVDEWHGTAGSGEVLMATWNALAGEWRKEGNRWSLTATLGELHLSTTDEAPPNEWTIPARRETPCRRGTLLTMRAAITPETVAEGVFRLGAATCAVGSASYAALHVEAAASFIDGASLWAAGFRGLHVEDEPILTASSPIDLYVAFEDGNGHIVAPADCVLRWSDDAGGGSLALSAGDFKSDFCEFDWSRIRAACAG